MLTGFQHQKIAVAGCEIDLLVSGEGSPILLLHGFPETKLAWHKMAPELAATHTVVIPDLPGYGDSTAPAPDPDYRNCSKRSMAKALVEVMQHLGFEQFAIAGHDRGGRVAYRMALDHPKKISHLIVLNIIPTLDMVEHLNYSTAMQMENWFFLAQPAPHPETMLQANADYYLQHILDSWSKIPSRILHEARTEYIRCFKKPEVIASICNEYRAANWDIEYDKEDRGKNNRIQCPVCVLWSKDDILPGIGDPIAIWSKWADKVTGAAVNGGHFLMEESADEVLDQFSNHLNEH
jgi:haloacetate dehalogenase